ncbi:type II toxin-antitoxin system Phd/YefM family antitoxin [bacterium]|nr:MAG: type II toxin-antitoxin system Phd/YefM family antitoxin [bacterium]
MNVKTTLSITEARKKIFEIADKVQEPMSYYTLTERGRPRAVIMSAKEFELWQETLEVQKMFPELEKDIEQVRQKIKTGSYKSCATLTEVHNKLK